MANDTSEVFKNEAKECIIRGCNIEIWQQQQTWSDAPSASLDCPLIIWRVLGSVVVFVSWSLLRRLCIICFVVWNQDMMDNREGGGVYNLTAIFGHFFVYMNVHIGLITGYAFGTKQRSLDLFSERGIFRHSAKLTR